SKNFLCMDHGSRRFWFRPILRCFKLVFFGEALQRSEIYLLKCTIWLSRVAGHPILERASAAIESDELASAAGCHRRIRKAGLVERQSVLAWRLTHHKKFEES